MEVMCPFLEFVEAEFDMDLDEVSCPFLASLDDDEVGYGSRVVYTLSDKDVDVIEKYSDIDVEVGEKYLMMVTSVDHFDTAQGHVYLDGPGSLWVSGVEYGYDEGEWHEDDED